MKIIGIAGGSGSGKTTLAHTLIKILGSSRAGLIYQDSYYRDQSANFDHDGGAVNFDHPSAIDFALLARHLQDLREGRAAPVPIYDFATHRRQLKTVPFQPTEIVLVDGILILSDPATRAQLDYSIFVETPEDLRFQRRLQRDVAERGRTPEGVRAQFTAQVAPMHDLYVEPSKKFASEVYRETPRLEVYAPELLHRILD